MFAASMSAVIALAGAAKERNLGFPSSICVEENSRPAESDHVDYYLELENENRATKHTSDLIVFDVRPISDGLG
jgi:hypothetical protein